MSFKALLIFPPVWLPETPFLSIPTLYSYLKSNGIETEQIDLNINFWNHFYENENIKKTYQNVKLIWKLLSSKKILTTNQYNLKLLLSSVIKLSEKQFLQEVTDATIEKNHYREIIKNASDYSINKSGLTNFKDKLIDDSFNYHDLLYSDISYSEFAESSASLIKIVGDQYKNEYHKFFNNNFINKIKLKSLDLIGISITAINQVVPAFTLAYLIKKEFPSIYIVIGGAWCTQIKDSLKNNLARFKYIDSVIIYEGEESLYKLCRALESNSKLDNIPNLIFNNGKDVIFSEKFYFANLDELPTPDFQNLPLEQYDNPLTLPLQTSRGCYWGKCTFCSYPVLEPKFKTRTVDKVINDIINLRDLYNIEEITFTDALMSPKFAELFSNRLQTEALNIKWVIFARFENKFTPDLIKLMSKSGCVQVSWGLESGNDRILKLIQKSIDLKHAASVLKSANESGIHNRVLVMFGHPTETLDEALQTITFVERNLINIHSISYNYYHPEIDTPIEKIAKQYKINLFKNSNKDLTFSYKWNSDISKGGLEYIALLYKKLANKISYIHNVDNLDLSQFIYSNTEFNNTNFRVKIESNKKFESNIVSVLYRKNGKLVRRYFEENSYL